MRAVRTSALVAIAGLLACSSTPGEGQTTTGSPNRQVDPPASDAPSATAPPPAAAPVDPLALQPLYTEHLGRLTATSRNPGESIGLRGTDLGSSFVRDGAVQFLFGDTMSVDPAKKDLDSTARAPLGLPADGSMPSLAWLTGQGGQFTPLAVPGVDLGTMNVPVEGVVAGDTTYVFFATQFDFEAKTWRRSTLAHGTDLASLTLDHDVATVKFQNVSVVVDGGDAWIFGSGRYRASPVYLARVPLAQIADRAAWRYLATGAFVAGEENATPVADASCVGELSVRKHERLGAWLMTYNCDAPRGIALRIATSPTGPWTAPERIFDPGALGYEKFMHAKESVVGHDDGLSQVGNEEDWGGEYAPYMVPSWFSEGAPGIYSIVYTLSSWNPYQVHLMRTVLGAPGATFTPPARGAGLPRATLANGDFAGGSLGGWTQEGDAFVTFQDASGAWRVSTYGAAGDATTGRLYQDFTVDAATKELAFAIHGGDARVTLTRDGDVVRSSHGRRTNDVETQVVWNLEEYRGETLRLAIEDDLTASWGFVGARGFVLH